MCRLQLLLLIVSSVLATVYSTDNDVFNTKATSRPDSRVTNHIARRRYQTPRVEIKEENAGRYFRRRPQTTTVSSIFSMKVENESQHVYPNIGQLEDTNTHHVRDQSHITTTTITGVPLQPSNTNSVTEKAIPKEKKIRRRITINRRHRIAQPTTSFNGQMEEHNEETEKVTSTTSTTTTTTTTTTTPAPTVIEATVKEQERKESIFTESQVLDPTSSLTYHISQALKPNSQKADEKTEKNITTTTSMPISISTTVTEMEKSEMAPTSSHVSNTMSVVKRRRPHFVQRVHSQPIKEIPTANENVDLSTSAPMVVTSTEKEQEKNIITPPPSYVADLISIVKKTKSHRHFMNRGSHKYGSKNIKKEQADLLTDTLNSTASQGTGTTANTEKPAKSVTIIAPPSAPTLSPWYDGFGK